MSVPSPLHAEHLRCGATLTDYAGWSMPLRYTSDLDEHRAVRQGAGLFDLSHMGEITLTGARAGAALDYALVGHLSALAVGRARYTMMVAPDGTVIDDLIVYRIAEDHYLVVANAANTPGVVAELTRRAQGFDTRVSDHTKDIALIAVQGPRAQVIVTGLMAREQAAAIRAMKYYAWVQADLAAADGMGADSPVSGGPGTTRALVARTGYTGEDGFELFVRSDDAPALWRALLAAGQSAGLIPCGLAARDSLRLEAGMPLYGHELDHTTTPYDAGLGRVVKLAKTDDAGRPVPFVGRDALAARAQMPGSRALVGLAGSGRRGPRAGYPVVGDGGAQVGRVTSGGPSPTLGYPIAMAYVLPHVADVGQALAVDVRGRSEPVRVVGLPFYRRSSA